MKFLLIIIALIGTGTMEAQKARLKQTTYRAILMRKDSQEVVFNLQSTMEHGKQVLYVINDIERIRITDIRLKGDSLIFNMPVFESSFFTTINPDGSLQGIWKKGTIGEPQQWPFSAYPNIALRFPVTETKMPVSLTGKWEVTFRNKDGSPEKALALFKQVKNKLSGSFLTTTGDYRYLDGVVNGDSVRLSTFDGSHAYLFTARIKDRNNLSGGMYYFGPAGYQSWTAVKNNNAEMPRQDAPCSLRKGETGINVAFNDLDGKKISLRDEKFKNKVVIVELMGSWCPNCMDETVFLTEFYRQNRRKGVEVIALAYEYTTDLQRSKASLEKFKKKFAIEYPVLITGVTAGDEKKTEKTLPQLTPIRSFPTTIIIDKKGNVREIQSVFFGPGTGTYYTGFVKNFTRTVNELLLEK